MDQWKAIFDWCTSHWAFCVFVIGMIFEIPSLKLKPFTRLLNMIGKNLNRDVSSRIDKINGDLDDVKRELDQVKKENEDQMKVIDQNDANFIRTTILEFANSLRHGIEHTQEEYDHIIDLNDRYEEYIQKYQIRNGRFMHAYNYILTKYSECLEHDTFLS